MNQIEKMEMTPLITDTQHDLTENQKTLWLARQLDLEAGLYNEPISIEIKGDLDPKRLQKALQSIVDKHIALQMNIVSTDDGLKQVRRVPAYAEMAFYDWSSYPSQRKNQMLQESLELNLCTNFELNTDALYRFHLYKLEDEEYLLHLTFHHIIFDGWSLGLLMRDLEKYYVSNRTVETEGIIRSNCLYENILKRHQNYIGSEQYIRSRKYWCEKLGGTLPWSAFPTSRTKILTAMYKGDTLQQKITPNLLHLVNQFSKSNQVSSYRVLLSVYSVLLHQMTNQTELIIGVPINTRNRDDQEREVFGYFVNTVPLRINCSPNQTFLELVQQVNESVQEVISHRDHPLDHVKPSLDTNDKKGRSSLFSTVFNMVKLPTLCIEDLDMKVSTHQKRVSVFDMVWRFVQESETDLNLEIDFNSGLYEKADIKNVMNRYQHLLQVMLDNSDVPIDQLETLVPQDYEVYQNQSSLLNNDGILKTLDQLIDEQADVHPERVAITMGEQSITYQELRMLSERVAHTLLEQGLEGGNRVSIIMDRSIEAVVSMVGVLKAGGTYVPVDPSFPIERIHLILKDSETTHILTNHKGDLQWSQFDGEVIVYEDIAIKGLSIKITRTHTSGDAAYIIYTSGSTGNPKGVIIPHQGVVHFIDSLKDTYHFQPNHVHLQFAALIFDASVWEIYSSLITGGRLHILSELERKSYSHFIKVIQEQQVNFCLLPTVFFHNLAQLPLEELQKLKSLHYIFVGGDTLLPETVRNWQEKMDLETPIVNAYGPTEATVCVATYPIMHKVDVLQGSIPIGKPLSHTEMYILNEQYQLCPPYVPGEIYIGGSSLAKGYMNQPDKTQTSFVTIDVPNAPKVRLYKSGDQGRITQDGQIEFLGRIDKQVKMNGYRIELEEIEEKLLQYPDVQHASVIAHQKKNGDQQLVAFYILQKDARTQAAEIQEYLAGKLPYFMLPSCMYRIDTFPLTPSGKVDGKELQNMANFLLDKHIHSYIAPKTDIEQQLQRIWAEVLQLEVEQISTKDDFFAIGGNSLLTVQIMNRIQARLHVQVHLKDLYTYRTIHACARYIEELQPLNTQNVVRPVSKRAHYPLSHAQERLWFLYKRYPDDRTYDIPIQVQINSSIQIHTLNKALFEMVKRHEIFRTIFMEKQGATVQHVLEDIDIIAAHVDMVHVKKCKQTEYRLKCIQKMDSSAFDLEQGPLFRAILFTGSENTSWLYFNFHHIIMDEWSLQRFLAELLEIYHSILNGAYVREREPIVRYVDYVAWQQEQLALGTWEVEKEYWKKEFENIVPPLSLPYDRMNMNPSSNCGGVFSEKIDAIQLLELKKVAQQEEVSLFTLLFTAYTQFLQQICGQTDIVIGTPVTGRQHEAFEEVQGFFVNTVAIRVDTSGASTMKELCQVVKGKCNLAFQHQNYPFDKVIEVVNPERGAHQNPIFQTMFSYQQNLMQEQKEYKWDARSVEQASSKFDLSLTFVENENGLIFEFEYNTGLFEKETIARFAEQVENILQIIPTKFTTDFCQLQVLSETDKKMYRQLNDTSMIMPAYASIQERFYQQVCSNPHAIAISTETGSYTYEEVNQRSNQIATYLVENGIRVNEVVAIYLDRSVESILCMLGILKSGGVYVPIDINYPTERVSYILNDSKAKVILTKQILIKDSLIQQGKVVAIEDVFASVAIQDILNKNKVEDPAYMIYTSGSTGKPKGTLLKHAGVLNLVEWRSRTFRMTKHDVLSQFYSHSFDSSVSEIFSALLTGARLHLLTEEQKFSSDTFLNAIATYNITISDVATAFFKQLANGISPKQLVLIDSLRVLIMGGEAASAEAIRKWKSKVGKEVQIVNEYGPTETTVSSLYYSVPEYVGNDVTNIPIGRPIGNTKIYILNEDMQPCPIGVIGELYIESVGVAITYVNQPDKTEQSFVCNPFSKEKRSHLYRTGDLVRLTLSGDIEYMGRRDRQLKIRGYRIELGEIEDVLLQEPRIQQAVVLPDEEGNELYAYFTVYNQSEIDIEEAYQHVSAVLPEFMVPKGYVCVPNIPVTQNGKIDVQKLMEQNQIQYRKSKIFQPPVTKIQKLLACAWEEVLEIKNISIQDDFFALGGHSLKIMPTLVRLKSHFPTLQIQDFFNYRTIEEMAEKIENDVLQREQRVAVHKESLKKEYVIHHATVESNQECGKCTSISQQSPRCVLLTGATGFLGSHILEQLLTIPDTIVYCLVRKQEKTSIENKIQEKMEFYFGEKIVGEMNQRVYVIEGDLSKEHVGFTKEIQKQVLQEIDMIIHCGGDVRHYGDKEHFMQVNVESTRYLLQMSKDAQASFHYISTISISGHAPHDTEEFLFSEYEFDRGQCLDNVYVESKFLAEKLVRDAMENGLSATVYRVGNLVGHSLDGRFQKNIEGNAFYRLIKAILLLKVAPNIHTYIDLVPIDFASKAIVQLACTKEAAKETFHICNPIQLEWGPFIQYIKQHGYPIHMVDDVQFMSLFEDSTLSDTQKYALELVVPLLEESDKNSLAIPTCQNAQRFLEGLGVVCDVPEEELVGKLMDYASRIGFFPLSKKYIMKLIQLNFY
ncbi:amino acid adenylation domain-containing protein [Bacillus thuringiensis]|uniref:non-ribosomal peptide synthetase n=1 Tax=Bacillus thuringiensis TaxID=1428 RepID=UPI000E4D8704|nr:non-ribosomal peptide synthetase [Bacillus thuringiensis]MDZ3952380.1 amino acid adenylation domain-containing protein [Bacillus thuringiensis]RGP45208.1 non-ribosomal peptide synthetase [Bacillus thuringiensis]